MENLIFILDELKKKRGKMERPYFVPELWNYFNYNDYSMSTDRKHEIDIDPYDFIASCIERHIIPGQSTGVNALTSLGVDNGKYTNDLSKSVIYGMFPRMLTAWDHFQKGEIRQGTFVKSLLYLPYLKRLGVDILYLMPVFKCSNKYKKGELGSPYSIRNIYAIDENLHDELLGGYNVSTIEREFKAFVEACHVLGMRVVLDFAFRTVSRDCELINEHPEWFYWIHKDENRSFQVPYVESEKRNTLIDSRTIRSLYNAKGIKEYLSSFTRSPKEIDEDKWETLKSRHLSTGENILSLIESEYKITTAPGFSNVLNDSQPPWTDVTYLRYYFDTHNEAREYVDKDQPPYILQDGICLNLYHGKEANLELWEYVSGIIPHYQTEYGIDGARIDMGHALPGSLNKEIVSRARANNHNFILWSEEFHPEKAEQAKNDGFHFISGTTWFVYKDVDKQDFNKELLSNILMKSALTLTASLETPDTPRSAYIHKDRARIKLLTMLNCFIPNAVPFICNGLEVMEVQPMNLGLDNTEAGRFVLPKNDPMYGKLAFFDNYQLHWLNDEGTWMRKVLQDSLDLRQRFLDLISIKENFIYIPALAKDEKITLLVYFDEKLKKGIFFLANRDFSSEVDINIMNFMPKTIVPSNETASIIYINDKLDNIEWKFNNNLLLPPGEVVIGCF